MTLPLDPTSIVSELAAARKYRHVCPQTIDRIAGWAAERYPNVKEAVKAGKRKLHQVYAAFLEGHYLDTLADRIERMPTVADEVAFREACLGLLNEHASTAERIPILTDLYPRLWAVTGVPKVLLDLACGNHPFGWPWFGLPADTDYRPCDLDLRLIAGLNAFLAKVGVRPQAEARDILAEIPACTADVALLFKTLATLEQQDRGVSVRLLRSIPAKRVVVSYPLKSLGGRDKGMRDTYDRQMQAILDELGWPATRLELPGELFFVLDRE